MSQEALRNTVAEFFQVDPGTIRADFVLGGARLSNSLARGHLDSVIRRRVGTKLAAVHSAKTYGELEAELLGVPAPAPSATQNSSAPASNGDGSSALATSVSLDGAGVRCGIDIELVESLPKAADYWEHEFYRTHFTRAEIAYCLMQEHPPIHFAARWCAKEALKKCDARYLKAEMTSIEVATSESGGMVLRELDAAGNARPLPHGLSISHTRFSAVAVVVAASFPATMSATSSNHPASSETAPPANQPAASRSGRIAVGVALLALVLAAIACLRTFHVI
jgi:phosphopantetheine--protein transferase-like protein